MPVAAAETGVAGKAPRFVLNAKVNLAAKWPGSLPRLARLKARRLANRATNSRPLAFCKPPGSTGT